MAKHVGRRYVYKATLEADTFPDLTKAMEAFAENGLRHIQEAREVYCEGNGFHFNARLTIDDAVSPFRLGAAAITSSVPKR